MISDAKDHTRQKINGVIQKKKQKKNHIKHKVHACLYIVAKHKAKDAYTWLATD